MSNSELESVTTEAVVQLKNRLNEAVVTLSKQHRKTGFGLQLLESIMNQGYNEIATQLQDYISARFSGALCAEALHFFEVESAKLKTEMLTLYHQYKMAALNAALNSASFNLDYCIKNNVTYLPSQLAQHASSVQQHLMQTVAGWFDGSPASDIVKDEFRQELQSILTNDIEVFKKHLVSSSSKKGKGKSVVLSEEQFLSSAVSGLKSSINSLMNSLSRQKPDGYSFELVNEAFYAKYAELEQSLPSDSCKADFKKSCETFYAQVQKNYEVQQENRFQLQTNRESKPSRQSSGSSVCSGHSHRSSKSHNSRLSENISAATSVAAAAAAAAASAAMMPGTPSGVKKRKDLQAKKGSTAVSSSSSSAATGARSQGGKGSAWEEQLEEGDDDDEVDPYYAATPLNVSRGSRRKSIASLSATPMKVASTPSRINGSSAGPGMRSGGSREDLQTLSQDTVRSSTGSSSSVAVGKITSASLKGGSSGVDVTNGVVGGGGGSNAIKESVQAKRRKSEGSSAAVSGLDSSDTVVISKSLGMSLADAKAAARQAEEERIQSAILKRAQRKST